MNCIDFLTGDLETQLTYAKFEKSIPLVFVHVPKTGGTSMQRDLNAAFPDSIHIPNENKNDHWAKAQEKIHQNQFCLVRGHLGYEDIKDLNQGKNTCRLVAYLRNPIDRLVSTYLFRRSKHRKNPQKYNPPGSFENFCRSNSMVTCTELLVGKVGSQQEAIDKIANMYWFVGLTEFFHVCQSVLFASLEVEYRIRQRRNQAAPIDEEISEIQDDCLSLAEEYIKTDLAIYQYFQMLWSGRINDSVELLLKPRPMPPVQRTKAA